MSFSPWKFLKRFMPGTLVRADAVNSQLEGIEQSFTELDNIYKTEMLLLPAGYQARNKIPNKTLSNALLYFDVDANLDVYHLADFDNKVQQAKDSALASNNSASESQQHASNASGSANAAATSKSQAEQAASNAAASMNKSYNFANAAFNVEVEAGKYSALHWAAVAETAASNAQSYATGTAPNALKLNGQPASFYGKQTDVDAVVSDVSEIISGAKSVGNASKLAGYSLNAGSAPWKVVLRDESSDVHARLFRSNYANQTTISGAMAFRVSNGSDNFIRFCSNQAAIRYWLDVFSKGEATQNFLAKAGKAADAFLLDGKRIDQVADYAFNLYTKYHEGPDGGTLNLPIAKFNYVSVWFNHGVIVLPNARAGDRVIVTIYNNGAGVVFNSGSYIQYFNSVDRGYSNNCSKKAKLTFECIGGNHWRISVSKIK